MPLTPSSLPLNEDMGEKHKKIFLQFPFRSIYTNTLSPISGVHLDFSCSPGAKAAAHTLWGPPRPRPFGIDFNEGHYYLYFMKSTPPLQLPQVNPQQREGRLGRYVFLLDEDIELIAGDGSEYARYMSRARPLIARYFEAGITTGVYSYGALTRSPTERIAYECLDVEGYRARLRGDHLHDQLQEILQRRAEYARVMDGILRLLRRAAFDLCALIGGVEWPSWLPDGSLAGVIVYASEVTRYSDMQNAEIYVLERWGIPIWIVERCEQNTRYELDASSYPELRQRQKERMHQEKLAHVRSRGVVVEEAYLEEGSIQSPSPLPARRADSDKVEEQLESLVLDALMPEGDSENIGFDEFSRRAGCVTGDTPPLVWNNDRYEPNLHGLVEGRRWHRSRPYPFDSRNTGAFFARIAVPPHYHDPALPFPTQQGKLRTPPATPVTVPKELWFCLELQFFKDLAAVGNVIQFAPDILAYRTMRTSKSATEGGFQEGVKPYVLQLWGKDRSRLADVVWSLPEQFLGRKHEEWESKDPSLPAHWTCFVNTEYISSVLARPCPAELQRDLLNLAPPMTPPSAGDPNYRPLKVQYIHALRHEILGGARFEPSIQKPSLSSIPQQMACFEFTKDYLENLVFQPRPASFSHRDYVEFHRLYIILDMLGGTIAFRMQLMLNNGPYSALFQEIAKCIQRDSAESREGCKYDSDPQSKAAHRMEGINWVPRLKRFSLYLRPGYLDLRPLNRFELGAWRQEERAGLEAELAKKKHQPCNVHSIVPASR
jgi:hypothetical protein